MPFGDGRGPRGGGMGGGCRRGPKGQAGPGGNCVCPSCGEKVVHKPGVPCSTMECPNCGMRMVRE